MATLNRFGNMGDFESSATGARARHWMWLWSMEDPSRYAEGMTIKETLCIDKGECHMVDLQMEANS
jgi:hypothetical protein